MGGIKSSASEKEKISIERMCFDLPSTTVGNFELQTILLTSKRRFQCNCGYKVVSNGGRKQKLLFCIFLSLF